MCKIADVIHTPDARIALQDEAKMYAALRSLQGTVIPKLYGYYEVWGILHMLALEPVGKVISEDRVITTTLRGKMKAALARIHSAGYIHGDIARRNFCQRRNSIFIVDLEWSRRSKGKWETRNEMQLIDQL
jgi:tRNA A-37 threonylcarbamoyl transferase component Bud32